MVRLGQLEAAVMDCLWAAGKAMTVREVLILINAERQLAYSTVMTVLDNLHRKRMVFRSKSGRAWVYVPAASRSAYTADLMERALDSSPDRGSALLRFVDQLPAAELAKVREALDRGGHDGSGTE